MDRVAQALHGPDRAVSGDELDAEMSNLDERLRPMPRGSADSRLRKRPVGENRGVSHPPALPSARSASDRSWGACAGALGIPVLTYVIGPGQGRGSRHGAATN